MNESGAIDFYFDFISHNAYLAWHEIGGLAESHRRPVDLKPVLFAGLLGAHGQLGPAEVLPKARWMVRDVLRKAAIRGIPLSPPASHPFNPLLALRSCGLPMAESDRQRWVDRLFRATWAESRAVDQPRVLIELAAEIGLDGEQLIAAAQLPEAKETLRRTTEKAVQDGVFGIPTMVVDGELFWGFDDFSFLDAFLAGRDPLPRSELQEWSQVKATATRRRPS